MEIIATFSSRCGACGERIHSGEMITAAGPGSWQHAPQCPPLPPGTRAAAAAPPAEPGTAREKEGKPPWCGVCDQRARMRDWYGPGNPYRCPDCHPLGPLPPRDPRISQHWSEQDEADAAASAGKWAAAIRADMKAAAAGGD